MKSQTFPKEVFAHLQRVRGGGWAEQVMTGKEDSKEGLSTKLESLIKELQRSRDCEQDN